MTPKNLLQETIIALSANRVRSGLTILGIVIGIASVIALVSVGQGASASISSNIQALGSNLLIVTPGAQRTPGGFGVSGGRGSARTLTQDDADALASQVENVVATASEVAGRYQVVASGTNTNTSVDGVTSQYPAIRNISIDEGAFITDQDNQNRSRVAVLGPTVVTDLFGTDATASDAVGQIIRINNQEFTVIGVTVSKGTTGFNNQDDMIYIPASTAGLLLTGNAYLTTIDIEASDASVMTQVQNDVTSLLLARHNIGDPTQADFSVLNQASILASASSITATLTYLLGAIAGISLLVGGIGIMNMMLTTVTERTREIGLRKAIGARRSDINRQFLSEAVALTLIGGIVGTLLGVGISLLLKATGAITTVITINSVALAFFVSAAIGIVFGYYPARRAASLNPIDALRYE